MFFKIGDRVIVKEWADMASEFRVDSDGDIDMGLSYFFRSMRGMCGLAGTINSFDDNDNTYDICLDYDDEGELSDEWVPEGALLPYVEPITIGEITFSFEDMLNGCS